MPSVLLIASHFDTGGQGARIVDLFGDDPEWAARSMARTATYFDYPADLPFRRASLEEQYLAADVIHCRNDFTEYDRLAAKHGPKPVVIHFHGTKFRGNPHHYLRMMRERKAIGLVSTLDLWLIAPDELTWLPAPYDVDALQALRDAAR